jgi:crotonobetainyl-CoA:carnitine CoA-transferase CaiB-like acyl-CoA transferase
MPVSDDPRFATDEKIAANAAEAVEILTKAIASHSLAEWSARFVTLAGPWEQIIELKTVGAVT